jgi:predicted phage-related endonuclease
MTIIDCEQRTPAWFEARLGRLTGSRAADMLATIKTGEAAARRDLRIQLVCERLTGQVQEDAFVNDAMRRGIACEPLAFRAYEALTGHVARTVGFIQHDAHMAGCSPDGLVDDDGVLELKCPKSATHLKYLRSGVLPSEYRPQIVHSLWVTGAAYADFVSFDDRFPVGMRVVHVRVPRDEKEVAEYEKTALAFLAEVQREVEAVATMHAPMRVLAEVVR